MAIRITANTRFVSPLGPWSLSDLEIILASARAAEGDISSIPARLWWSAFLLTMLDTAEPPAILLKAPAKSYNPQVGALSLGASVYELHPAAVCALNLIIPFGESQLFPWPFDSSRKVFHSLIRHYKEILYRANMSHVTANLFPRLLLTAQSESDLLKRIDLSGTYALRRDRPAFPRARDRRPGASAAESAHYRADKRDATKDKPPGELHLIQMDKKRTLLHFFESSYAPLRLVDAVESSKLEYHTTLKFFSQFCACDATFANLTEDKVERFLAWLKQSGRANATINRRRAMLLALWRHAWRKKLKDDLPRDVPKLRESKRVPEAWSIEDVSRILQSASNTPGRICGIPAKDWWIALLMVLYDTGLRIAAVMQIKVSDLDLASRWLKIPAERQKQDADQVFRLHPDTLAAILRMNPDSKGHLFPWPFDHDGKTSVLANRYRDILIRAGLPHGKRDLFHKLRRTSGTAVAAAMDEQAAKRHLGHSSMDVTKRYIDPRLLKKQTDTSERISRPDLQIVRDDEREHIAVG